MRYTSVLPVNLCYDTSVFKDYTVKKTKHYCVINYDEKDCEKIINLLIESITDDSEKNISIKSDNFDLLQAIDEKGNVYGISRKAIKKRNQKLTLKKYIRLIKHNDISRLRYDNNSKKRLDSVDKTTIKRRFSIAPFKHYWFISKDYNIAFPFRLKPSKNKNSPILIYLHGGGCCGTNGITTYSEFINFGPSIKAKKHDCTTILPQFPNKIFVASEFDNYLAAVKQLSEIVCNDYHCNKNRIYVFGGSFGGRLTWRMAYKYPHYFACAMPMLGALDIQEIDYTKFKDIPLMVVHAADDMVVPIEYDDKLVKEIKKISDKVIYHRWEEYGHGMMPHFCKTVDWDKWMFEQSLEKR